MVTEMRGILAQAETVRNRRKRGGEYARLNGGKRIREMRYPGNRAPDSQPVILGVSRPHPRANSSDACTSSSTDPENARARMPCPSGRRPGSPRRGSPGRREAFCADESRRTRRRRRPGLRPLSKTPARPIARRVRPAAVCPGERPLRSPEEGEPFSPKRQCSRENNVGLHLEDRLPDSRGTNRRRSTTKTRRH